MRMPLIALGFAALLTLPAVAQEASFVAGTVKKIDTAQGKLTLDHGPIKNLDMDGMTMVFKAGDPAMLTTIKPGDKVRFTADRVNGQLTVTSVKKAP